jgi:hypothetical protein
LDGKNRDWELDNQISYRNAKKGRVVSTAIEIQEAATRQAVMTENEKGPGCPAMTPQHTGPPGCFRKV